MRAEALGAFVGALRKYPRAQVIDITGSVRTIEFTGSGAEVGEFLAAFAKIGEIVELARSGTAAVERGLSVLSHASPRLRLQSA